ncbi:dipeptide epimerase [Sphingorhabdus arenilitoris]|uniref:Dipeptide epimerase n=1 Tax=Sphingorhabdus arenilitoris TaxID=1490041 RepID=A0ABV8RK06_9SPHN
MGLMISAVIECWPVNGEFIIARGAKTDVDVLVVAVCDGDYTGMGESTAIYYDGETAGRCLNQVMSVADQLHDMESMTAKQAVQSLLPRGAARNALDCALWDLAAQQAAMPLWQFAGLPQPKPLLTAFTISLGEAGAMQADAARAAEQGYRLLKLKLTGDGDAERVAAVRAGAPDARLIVDANESWTGLDIAAEAQALADLGVEMVEQPLPHSDDGALARVTASLPLIADESCHDAGDVVRCAHLYDGINIKLDKAGGLTEAIEMAHQARAAGLKIMSGCMLSTSLGIAPAFLLAQLADWVDLDGPALLAGDRDDAFRFADGMILPPL